MTIHNCSPNTWKAEASGSGSSHISLENKLKASSDYLRPCCGVRGRQATFPHKTASKALTCILVTKEAGEPQVPGQSGLHGNLLRLLKTTEEMAHTGRMERLGLLCTAGGDVKWLITAKLQCGDSSKFHLLHNSVIPLLSMYPPTKAGCCNGNSYPC